MTAPEIMRYIERERVRQGLGSKALSRSIGMYDSYWSVQMSNSRNQKRDIMLGTVIKMADAVGLELHLRPKGSIDQVETEKPLLCVEVR